MKKLLPNSPLIFVMPLVIVGTVHNGKYNFAPNGQCGQVNYENAVICISVAKSSQTWANITQTRSFSLNVPKSGLLDKIRHAGSLSGADCDKSNLFDVSESKNGLPLIESCSLSMACDLVNTVEFDKFQVFFGKITECYAEDDCFENGDLSAEKINPLLCSLDGKYWNITEPK